MEKEKPKRKQNLVYVDEATHAKAKAEAEKRGMTLKGLIKLAIDNLK